MKRKNALMFGIIVISILLMNTALALCEDGNYSTNFLYISPSDDSYVDSSNPNTNYGTQSYMYAYTSYKSSYLKLAIPEVENIVSAKLMINNETAGLIYVKEVDSNLWDEGSITYNNRPLMGDTIIEKTFGTSPYTEIRMPYYIDITDWLNDRLDNEETSVSVGISTDSSNVHIHSKNQSVGWMALWKPFFIIEYGNPIDPLDTTIKNKTYDYANVTTEDPLNKVYYISNTTTGHTFNGTELTDAEYLKVGVNDANYVRATSPVSTAGKVAYRFETKIDENASVIKRIEIHHFLYTSYTTGTSPMDDVMSLGIYDNESTAWVYQNANTFGNFEKLGSRTSFLTLKDYTIYITDEIDRYINDDGVLKYSVYTDDQASYGINLDTYYYQVKVYYYDPPVVTPDPGDDDEGTPDSPVYPDLTDDTPVISVDGQYTGDLQNVLFRNLINFNDSYGIPTWAFILIGGLIGVWKRRPELVIFCGLLFLFLLFFGYKLEMTVV
ncbi:MAG: DNRLRE domain-containing protein [Candidatus Methanofastidiosa archaeon]|nr:DNRLRE domain-containing protein [Candidatus Methanofastidiosa archaeon]